MGPAMALAAATDPVTGTTSGLSFDEVEGQ